MKFSFAKLTEYRKSKGQNQFAFWNRLGVTQSGGSRYESGRGLPVPTAALLWLVENEKVSEKDLEAAIKAVKKST